MFALSGNLTRNNRGSENCKISVKSFLELSQLCLMSYCRIAHPFQVSKVAYTRSMMNLYHMWFQNSFSSLNVLLHLVCCVGMNPIIFSLLTLFIYVCWGNLEPLLFEGNEIAHSTPSVWSSWYPVIFSYLFPKPLAYWIPFDNPNIIMLNAWPFLMFIIHGGSFVVDCLVRTCHHLDAGIGAVASVGYFVLSWCVDMIFLFLTHPWLSWVLPCKSRWPCPTWWFCWRSQANLHEAKL